MKKFSGWMIFVLVLFVWGLYNTIKSYRNMKKDIKTAASSSNPDSGKAVLGAFGNGIGFWFGAFMTFVWGIVFFILYKNAPVKYN